MLVINIQKVQSFYSYDISIQMLTISSDGATRWESGLNLVEPKWNHCIRFHGSCLVDMLDLNIGACPDQEADPENLFQLLRHCHETYV